MAKQNNESGAKLAPFDPAKLTIEQQEMVVEEYLGYHPKYFLYVGNKILFNESRFSHEERSKIEKNGGNRKWFNGWKPNKKKYTG